MAKNEAIHGDRVPSYIAGAAFANNYRAVKLATARNTVELATAVSDGVIWIIQNTAAQGDHVAVKTGGKSLAYVGTGNWTKGAKLTASTGGALIATTTNTDLVCAIAQEAATAGELGEVELLRVPQDYASLV